MLQAILIMCAIAGSLGIVLVLVEHFLASYGICVITVNKEKKLEVEGGDTLLSGLLANKIFIPSACGAKATCGFCKVKVEAGGGSILPTETPFFTKAEIRENMRLACQIKVKTNLDITIPEEFLYVQEFKITCVKVTNLTHDTKEFIFRLDQPDTLSFKPGQYIQYNVPDTTEYRAYSVASKPSQQNQIKLVVRLVPGGICTTYMHTKLKEGDHGYMTGPYGEFYLREESPKDIIMIAGGSGMAPMLSILGHLIDKKSPRKVTLFFGARSKKDLYYTEELRKIEAEHPTFKYVPALSEPKPEDEWTGEVGLITNVVDRYLPEDAHGFEAYLCGPPVMIDAAMKVLTSRGIAEKEIYFDKF